MTKNTIELVSVCGSYQAKMQKELKFTLVPTFVSIMTHICSDWVSCTRLHPPFLHTQTQSGCIQGRAAPGFHFMDLAASLTHTHIHVHTPLPCSKILLISLYCPNQSLASLTVFNIQHCKMVHEPFVSVYITH